MGVSKTLTFEGGKIEFKKKSWLTFCFGKSFVFVFLYVYEFVCLFVCLLSGKSRFWFCFCSFADVYIRIQ